MTELNYMQRKALRRLARGQTIPHRMLKDPIISQCVTWPQLEPPKPKDQMNIIEYFDWFELVRHTRPTINNYGKELLKGLE